MENMGKNENFANALILKVGFYSVVHAKNVGELLNNGL